MTPAPENDWLAAARAAMEIEAESIHRAAARLDGELMRAVKLILAHPGKVIVTGIGKSGHIARTIVATLCSTGTAAVFLHPAEAVHGDLGIYTPGDPTVRQLHDELDEAVFAAYGWTPGIPAEQILANVVALNAQRRAEEASGIVRWLRPEFQAPNAPAIQQTLGGLIPGEVPAAARRKQPWPETLTDQFRAIKDALRATPFQTPQQIPSGFKPASRTRVQEILQTLTALGQTRQVEDRYLL